MEVERQISAGLPRKIEYISRPEVRSVFLSFSGGKVKFSPSLRSFFDNEVEDEEDEGDEGARIDRTEKEEGVLSENVLQ